MHLFLQWNQLTDLSSPAVIVDALAASDASVDNAGSCCAIDSADAGADSELIDRYRGGVE